MAAERSRSVSLPTGKPSRATAYDKLQQAIINGTLAPGTPLVEGTLAEWCGVSRTPVREALMRLEQDGLVERTDRGVVVRERSPEEILDIYEMRIVLEETAARLAAERHTSMDRMRLEKALKSAEDLDDPDGALRSQRNHAFHERVWLATHNNALVDLLDRLNRHLTRYPATTLTYGDRWSDGLRQHRELVDAIAARDAEAAAEIARNHFTEARDIRLEMWSEDTV